MEQREDVRDLLVRDEPGFDGLLSNLPEICTNQARAGGLALPHGQIAFHAYIDKAMRSQAPVQAPAPCQCQLTTSCCHEPVLGRHHFLKERRGSSICRRIPGVDKGRIEIFHDEPASWLESGYHPLESLLACWHVDEYQPGVDQVKGLCGHWIGANIVARDLNNGLVKGRKLQEKARVDGGDEDSTGGAAALTKPRRNRSPTTADFPARPAIVASAAFH